MFNVCCSCRCQRLQISIVSLFCRLCCLWDFLRTLLQSLCFVALSAVIHCYIRALLVWCWGTKCSIILWLNPSGLACLGPWDVTFPSGSQIHPHLGKTGKAEEAGGGQGTSPRWYKALVVFFLKSGALLWRMLWTYFLLATEDYIYTDVNLDFYQIFPRKSIHIFHNCV